MFAVMCGGQCSGHDFSHIWSRSVSHGVMGLSYREVIFCMGVFTLLYMSLLLNK